IGYGVRTARRSPSARMGSRDEDGSGLARRHSAGSRDGVPHLRLSGAGDLRLLLRASRARRDCGHLLAFVVREPGTHFLSLSAALYAASLSVAIPRGVEAAQLGREIVAGIRHSWRAVSGR